MNTADEQAIIEGLRAFARMLAREIAGALERSPREPPPPAPVTTRLRPDRYLTAQEVSDILALPLGSVWHHARNGTIPSLKVGASYASVWKP